MSENTQSMAIFSVHHLTASASVELTTKSGFKLEGGEIKPSAEASGTRKITISTGNAKVCQCRNVKKIYSIDYCWKWHKWSNF